MIFRERLRIIKAYFIYSYNFITSRDIREKYKKLNILDDKKTIEKIVLEKMSISRFGDGEFCCLLNCEGTPKFQETNEQLSLRLKEVLTNNTDKLLVCIPRCMVYNDEMLIGPRTFWCSFTKQHGKDIYKLLDNNKIYGNTNFSRFYIDYIDKASSKVKIDRIKSIWNKKNIVIVEENNTKLGVGNDLLDNCKSIKRIICPSKNAFSKYDEILSTIENVVSKDYLILIALGPTATILAYDLTKEGYQVIDIGHTDIEYEWYLNGVKNKSPIKGKAVNEVSDKSVEDLDITDEKYIKSIIAQIFD